ncbi:hypothetical protein PFISCL1PPCAC_6946, partial [Pristionchus fissidentatus]
WFEYSYTVVSEWTKLMSKSEVDGLLSYCTSVSHSGVTAATRLVIPCALSYFLFYIGTLIGAFVSSSVSTRGNLMLGTIIKELSTLTFNTYSLVFPLILLIREPDLRFRRVKLPRSLREPPVSEHFDVVTSMWELNMSPSSSSSFFCCLSLRRKPVPLSP